MDRGAWQATFHTVTNRRHLGDFKHTCKEMIMGAKVTKCGLMIPNFMCQMKECFGVRFIFKSVNIQ